jgi:hypothetical protein
MPSSVVASYRYIPEDRVLRVVFVSGLVYDYQNVPQEVYDQMKSTLSKGQFLNKEIKGKYAFRKRTGLPE